MSVVNNVLRIEKCNLLRVCLEVLIEMKGNLVSIDQYRDTI